MNYVTKTYVIAALALMLALALACGGGRKTPVAPIITPPPDNTNPNVEEVQNTPVPQGIDAAMWATLTTELISQLETMTEADRDQVKFNWIPTGIGPGWDNAFMRPDGNNDDRVDVLDLVPLAQHFGEEWVNGEGHPTFADYKSDGKIDLADVSMVAHNYGLACGGYKVEFSTTSAEEGFSAAGSLGYADYFSSSAEGSLRWFRFACDTKYLEPLWIKVSVTDNAGATIASQIWAPENPIGPSAANYTERTSQPAVLPAISNTITWSTHNLLPDGNQDGVTNAYDSGAVADWFGDVADCPLAAVADYDDSGIVGVSDVALTSNHFGWSVEYFIIEVSSTSASSGFASVGQVEYVNSTGFNEGGFRYYEFTIPSPPSMPYWARIVPVGYDGDYGDPSDAVEFTP